jgi:hypothetical protein
MPPREEETVGPLAGLSGVLPAEPGIVQFGKPPSFSTKVEITESQGRHAAAFARLLAAEHQPTHDQQKLGTLPARVLNLITGAVLILAVLIPIITSSQGAPRPGLEALPESASVFTLIESLPPGATVLAAFEIEPSLYGEMKAGAAAVITHLLDKQARLVLISTQPTGPAIGERLFREELSQLPTSSQEPINLGYFSGGTAALRSFSNDPRSATMSTAASLRNPWNNPTLEAINDLSDFDLVVIFSSDAQDAKAWIEQAGEISNEGILAVTSAQAGPLLRPYLQSDPLVLTGLVSGTAGSNYYERLRGLDGGHVYWDAYSYGLGAVAMLVLFGGLYSRLVEARNPSRVSPTKSENDA